MEFYFLGFPGSKELCNILFATFFFFYSVSLIGNMVIIFMVCIDKRLQSPMYFFLDHLSVLERLTTTVTVPLMLWGLLLPGMLVVSLTACCIHLYLYLSLGTSKLLLFTAMAVDRFVAVCNPLRYTIIMNSHTCLWVVIASWVFGFLFQIWPVYATFHLTFCKSNVLDHFYCDRGQLFKLSCDKGRFTELMLFLMSIFILFWFFDAYDYLLHLHHLHHPQDPFRLSPLENRLYMCLPLHLCGDWLQQLFVPLCETQPNTGSWVQQSGITDGFSGEPFSEPFYLHPPEWQIHRGVSRRHEKLLPTPQGLAMS